MSDPRLDWPMSRGDAGRTGTGAALPAGPLAARWHFAVPSTGALLVPPVAAGGWAFLPGDRYGPDLFAIDLATGTARWHAEIGRTADDDRLDNPRLAVAGGHVVAGVDTAEIGSGQHRHALVALDGAGGAVRWRHAFADAWSQSAPVVAGAMVAVAIQGEEGGRVLAFEVATGAARWEARGGPAEPQSVPLAVDGEAIYALAFRGETREAFVVALDVADGRERWRASSPGAALGASIVATGGTVFVLAGDYHARPVRGRLTAFDAATGAPRWGIETNLAAGAPAVSGDTIYLTTMATREPPWRGYRLLALDAVTGAERWRAEQVTGSPVVAGGVVYGECVDLVLGEYALAGFDAATGQVVWRGEGMRGALAVAGGLLLAGGIDGLSALAPGP